MIQILILIFTSTLIMAQESQLKPQFIAPEGSPNTSTPAAPAPALNQGPSSGIPTPATSGTPPNKATQNQNRKNPPQNPTPEPVGQQQQPPQPGAQPPPYGGGMGGMPGMGEHHDGPTGARGEYFGPGIMQKCDSPPSTAQKAYEEAKNFRNACGHAQRGESQKIAVNDYSTRPSYMYIFDLQGKCLGKTMVAFGNGAGGAQVACSDHGSNLSPPGFHLTAEHHGSGKYGPSNSMKMVGLQGQDSAGRGILIHPARAPGTSSTWGCAGVGYSAFNAVKKTLGYGALVYNYWRPEQMGNACRSRAGMNNAGACQPDRGSPSIPGNATGEGVPAVAWWDGQLLPEAHAAEFPAPRLRIKKGTEVVIFRQLGESEAYEIKMTREEAVGPNVATLKSLKKAFGYSNESNAEFKKRLARDSGAVYILKADLPLLWEEEVFQMVKGH